MGLLLAPAAAWGSEILLRLTGSSGFPGMLSFEDGENRLERICFLGMDARGNLDDFFLVSLGRDQVPRGEYAISDALPEEQWPTPSFVKWGALRFVPRTPEAAQWFARTGKHGLAVHGRDFFPLAARMTDHPKMVRFISDRLFEQLEAGWGALRISNWDMGRLYDYYERFVTAPAEWKVRVTAGSLEEITTVCEPLKVQRKPGGPLE